MKKHKTSFKSPFQKGQGARSEEGVARETVEQLQQKVDGICQQIEELKSQGYRETELKTHIDKLHEYNEVKDIAQSVLGQLVPQLVCEFMRKQHNMKGHLTSTTHLDFNRETVAATLKGVRTKDLYEHYGLNLDD